MTNEEKELFTLINQHNTDEELMDELDDQEIQFDDAFQEQFYDQLSNFSNDDILLYILLTYREHEDFVAQLDHYAPDGEMVVQLYEVVPAGETTRTQTYDWFYVNVLTGEYTSVFKGHQGKIEKQDYNDNE